jgi:hypothetical protein
MGLGHDHYRPTGTYNRKASECRIGVYRGSSLLSYESDREHAVRILGIMAGVDLSPDERRDGRVVVEGLEYAVREIPRR